MSSPPTPQRKFLGGVVRRSSTAFSIPGLPNRTDTPPPSQHPDSTSLSRAPLSRKLDRGSTTSLNKIDTSPLPAPVAVSRTPSLIPESPARDAVIPWTPSPSRSVRSRGSDRSLGSRNQSSDESNESGGHRRGSQNDVHLGERSGQGSRDPITRESWPIPDDPPMKGTNKPGEQKTQTLACLFCRERKIACSRPAAHIPDQTCNQCARRRIKCEYPTESRRGQHKRRRKYWKTNIS